MIDVSVFWDSRNLVCVLLSSGIVSRVQTARGAMGVKIPLAVCNPWGARSSKGCKGFLTCAHTRGILAKPLYIFLLASRVGIRTLAPIADARITWPSCCKGYFYAHCTPCSHYYTYYFFFKIKINKNNKIEEKKRRKRKNRANRAHPYGLLFRLCAGFWLSAVVWEHQRRLPNTRGRGE